jgi:hypothetical protein
MMPRVKRRSDDQLIPLQEDFENLMRLIGVGVDEHGKPLPVGERQAEYQRELLGSRVIDEAPYLYWDTLTMLDSGVVAVWDELPIRTRARIKAAMRIRNMAETIEKHRGMQAAKAKKAKVGSV